MNPSRLAIRPVGSPEAGQVRPPLLSDLHLELNKGDTVPRAQVAMSLAMYMAREPGLEKNIRSGQVQNRR